RASADLTYRTTAIVPASASTERAKASVRPRKSGSPKRKGRVRRARARTTVRAAGGVTPRAVSCAGGATGVSRRPPVATFRNAGEDCPSEAVLLPSDLHLRQRLALERHDRRGERGVAERSGELLPVAQHPLEEL